MATLRNALHQWREDRGPREGVLPAENRKHSLYIGLPSRFSHLKPRTWFVPLTNIRGAGPFIKLPYEVIVVNGPFKAEIKYNAISVSTGMPLRFDASTKVKIIKGTHEGIK